MASVTDSGEVGGAAPTPRHTNTHWQATRTLKGDHTCAAGDQHGTPRTHKGLPSQPTHTDTLSTHSRPEADAPGTQLHTPQTYVHTHVHSFTRTHKTTRRHTHTRAYTHIHAHTLVRTLTPDKGQTHGVPQNLTFTPSALPFRHLHTCYTQTHPDTAGRHAHTHRTFTSTADL